MKKVLKLSSLLAAVLLLAALAGVQLLSAQATEVALDKAYVSNDKLAGTDNVFRVTLTYDPNGTAGGADAWMTDYEMATTSITVKNNTTENATSTYKLQANASTTENVWLLDVTVQAVTSSPADQIGVRVVDDVDPVDPEQAGLGTIHGLHGDEIVVNFSPLGSFTRSATIIVDAEGPVITNLFPAHNYRTQGGLIRFSATVTDSGSGLGADADAVAENTEIILDGEEVVNKATKPADGASTVTITPTLGSQIYPWSVTAKDLLGNSGKSVAVAGVKDDPDTEGDETVPEVPNNRLVVDDDSPTITSAVTGSVLDTSGDAPAATSTGSRTAIAVTFTDGGPVAAEEGGGLNGTTIDDSDFRVDIDKLEQDIASVVWNESLPKMVFITLENDLAGDDQPVVRLVGPVDDVAGNSQGTGEVTAVDGIAPIVSVSVDGSAGTVTNGTLTVLVSADEKSRNPARTSGITVTEVMFGTGDKAEKQVVGTKTKTAAAFRTVTTGEQWEWTFNFREGANSKYNVCVEIADISDISDAGNVGMAGTCEAAALIDADKSITFEVDTGVAAPMVTPDKTDNVFAFIEVDLSGESDEYVGDSEGTVASVTVSIDGETVDTASLDDTVFSIAPPADGYAIGTLAIVVTATDTAGNTGTFNDITVEITERVAFTVNLRPGYNLISLPGTPVSTDINDVIGADHAINQVLTYSPFVEGGWLSAERGDDGAFAGTLTTIDGSTAYIVRTSNFDPLEVIIPRMALGNVLPPQTNLGIGWNLVPVIDLSSDLETGETIVDYFQGIGEAILEIDPSGRLAAIDGDDATVGKGYWIYASRAAVLLPTRR